MNWSEIKGNWNQFMGAAKARWGKLTDNDLMEAEGERDKLVGKIQEAYGISKEEAEKQVDDFKWS